jgi:uncharacterized membrane protein
VPVASSLRVAAAIAVTSRNGVAMFDPVSLIVGALVNGALGGVQASAQDAVLEGYTKLRTYLARRYGGKVEASINLLEQHPDSPQIRAAVARELRTAGADRDQELAQLARGLTAIIENPDAFGTFEPPDPVEQLRRSTGLRAVGNLLEQHVGKVLTIRQRYDLNDVDLLSRNIARERDLPRRVRDEVTGLHERIRAVIEQIASQIEQGRYADVERAVASFQAGYAERERAQRLIEADKGVQAAYDALRMTVEFFSELNRTVLMRIESETAPDRQSTMMFGNAVMIYELTDFVIGYIQAFTVNTDLEQFHVEAKQRVQQTREQQKALEEMARNPDVEPVVRDQILEDIRNREAAFDELEREWDRYLAEFRQLRLRVDEVRGKVPTLATIRENARIQIMTLQLVAMLRFLKQNSDSIKGAVDTLQGFRLAPLSSTRVRRLIGV